MGLVEFMLLEWLRLLPHGSSGKKNYYVIW